MNRFWSTMGSCNRQGVKAMSCGCIVPFIRTMSPPARHTLKKTASINPAGGRCSLESMSGERVGKPQRLSAGDLVSFRGQLHSGGVCSCAMVERPSIPQGARWALSPRFVCHASVGEVLSTFLWKIRWSVRASERAIRREHG